jgi:hypothetical protein
LQVAVLEKNCKVISIKRLECNRLRNPENETELKQLENVLVAKLDVLELDSIKKRLKMVFKIWKC